MNTPLSNAGATDHPDRTPLADQRAQFVSISRTPGAVVARLVTPAIGQREAPIIEFEIREALDERDSGCRWLVVDMSAVSVLSSMGLGMCVELRRQARERRMRTAIFGLNGHLRDLFRMMKVDRLFRMVHAREDFRKLTGR